MEADLKLWHYSPPTPSSPTCCYCAIGESKYPGLLWYQIRFADLSWRESLVKMLLSRGFSHLEPCRGFWTLVIYYSFVILWFMESPAGNIQGYKGKSINYQWSGAKSHPCARSGMGFQGYEIRLGKWTCRGAGAVWWEGLNQEPLTAGEGCIIRLDPLLCGV